MSGKRFPHRAEVFEQVLLDYVEMCYSVALTFTGNSAAAEDLTREVLPWAWQLPDNAKDPVQIKAMLLGEMRASYLRNRAGSRPRERTCAAYA